MIFNSHIVDRLKNRMQLIVLDLADSNTSK